jgi:hypothetical protein
VRCAKLAREAGYDGVEVMGSEGYFINQFLVTHTNQRSDAGAAPTRTACGCRWRSCGACARPWGPDFIIIYRISLIDLIPDGSSWPEVLQLARAVTAAGATILNTGIGWHEARVPTIATSVPRAAFAWVTKKLRTRCAPRASRHPWSPATASTCPRLPRGAGRRRRRHGEPGAPLPGRRRLRQQGHAGPERRNQHLHRLQPGLPGPRLREPLPAAW